MIEAYFNNLKAANDTIYKLRVMGIDATLDLKDDHMENYNARQNVAGTATGATLSDLVLKSGASAVESHQSPLMAANPMVSGMAGFEETVSLDYKIAITAGPRDNNRIAKIVEEAGGAIL
ncbi:hypothetical protein [Alkaliphilus serpentinus]|uniref:Uncharacterized protein n=1 Tax=Alkaliphilus serpentinus TaxID=1482731 RepID=A0A833HN04_9FIRM|nr:hypothetical protein [Alkaliphilus serpentinus]KAB3529078.1 hypothetical protein F8153_10525 [Alkaliphilus serpentinus]